MTDNARMRRRSVVLASLAGPPARLLCGPLRGAPAGGFALAGGFAAPVAAGVIKVEGVRFEDRAQLAGAELVLNGTGVRAVAWLKGYVAGLYLVRRASSAAEVQALPGPKRLRMVMLQGAPAAEFVKAFEKGLTRNSSEAEAAALRGRMDRFERALEGIGKVVPGDLVDLDFDPARGTSLVFNGRAREEPIAGADFYAALLRSFVGERPYDKRLRAGLLGVAA